jgi:XRE family transcriptional regulator, aerobic/anaerobic benzoate catabolism transcriptional regulator
MSPDLVDQAILACCKPQFLKVARIVGDVATALKLPRDVDKDFIAERIKTLVKLERLESQGDLDRWRFSEIRLPEIMKPPATQALGAGGLHDERTRKMSDTPDSEAGFLEQLGQRVRTMRGLRGMSRKVLAKVSGISERYIAQLESGKGNVSIVLLRRVSSAMGAHLEDLIPAGESAPDWPVIRDLLRQATPSQIAQARDVLAGQGAAQRRNSFAGIALIGLRGAGKSTLGRMLAKKIGWNFVELNKEIEAQNGLSVAEIIALYGQEGFRRMEQAALGQLLARKELMVLATGGGIVSEPLTFDLILSSFYTIWLKAEPEEHMARVRRQGDLRPMADDRSAMAELRNILLSREPLYARASTTVDTAGLSVDAAAARLIDAVRPVLQNEARAFGLRSVAV